MNFKIYCVTIKGLVLLALLLSQTLLAQKTYSFDTLLEYESIYYESNEDKDSLISKVGPSILLMTNSKDNSYKVSIKEEDANHYKINFQEFGKTQALFTISKENFIAASTINVDCDVVLYLGKYYKSKTKFYNFEVRRDTLINDKSYKQYAIKPQNTRRSKRKKLGSHLYIIDPATTSSLPPFMRAIVYDIWKLTPNLSTGIYAERIVYNYYGEMVRKNILRKRDTLHKDFIIPQNCPENRTFRIQYQ